MKYEGFQQLIATMEAAGYDYKAEIALIEKKKQALSVGSKGLPAFGAYPHHGLCPAFQ